MVTIQFESSSETPLEIMDILQPYVRRDDFVLFEDYIMSQLHFLTASLVDETGNVLEFTEYHIENDDIVALLFIDDQVYINDLHVSDIDYNRILDLLENV